MFPSFKVLREEALLVSPPSYIIIPIIIKIIRHAWTKLKTSEGMNDQSELSLVRNIFKKRIFQMLSSDINTRILTSTVLMVVIDPTAYLKLIFFFFLNLWAVKSV